MNSKTTLALFLVAVIGLSVLVPVSHASTVTVVLNPANNEATVDAYINSSLTISATNSSFIGQTLLKDVLTSSSEKNITINSTSQGISSVAFSVLNKSLSERDPSAKLIDLSLGYQSVIDNSTSNGMVMVYANTSLVIHMVIGGVFSNNSANLSWRNFSTDQGLSVNGTDVNNAKLPGGYFSSSSVSTVNLTAFSKSLVQWNRSYDSAANTTTFSMNAGKTVDLHYNGSNSGYNFSLTYTLDPSYSISAPGYDQATNDSIVIGNPPAGSPVLIYVIAAVMVGGAIVLMYVRRRGAR